MSQPYWEQAIVLQTTKFAGIFVIILQNNFDPIFLPNGQFIQCHPQHLAPHQQHHHPKDWRCTHLPYREYCHHHPKLNQMCWLLFWQSFLKSNIHGLSTFLLVDSDAYTSFKLFSFLHSSKSSTTTKPQTLYNVADDQSRFEVMYQISDSSAKFWLTHSLCSLLEERPTGWNSKENTPSLKFPSWKRGLMRSDSACKSIITSQLSREIISKSLLSPFTMNRNQPNTIILLARLLLLSPHHPLLMIPDSPITCTSTKRSMLHLIIYQRHGNSLRCTTDWCNIISTLPHTMMKPRL